MKPVRQNFTQSQPASRVGLGASGAAAAGICRWRCLRWLLVVGIAAAGMKSVPSVRADGIYAGVAKAEITPAPGVKNEMYKFAPFGGMLTPLQLRVLVIGDGARKIALVQWDLVYAHAGAVAKVRELVSAETGIPPGDILVNASHSHSAPEPPFLNVERLAREEIESVLPAQLGPEYQQWAGQLFAACRQAAKVANASLQPVTLEIGRATVPEWQYNRRPRRPDGTVESILRPEDPAIMPAGLRFGPMDPTLTVLILRNRAHQPLATLFNYPCHPVSVYVDSRSVSADWPGYAADQIETSLGGCAIFLQGCAGDLVPARRGLEAARKMGALIGERAAHAAGRPLRIDVGALQVRAAMVALPLTAEKRLDLGREAAIAEVQVFVLGSVAIVALPGEPMIELALAIQKQSPYPHTVVLGYSNGVGVYYVGLPGEKARGGFYGGIWGFGTDECGAIMVEAALRLLRETGPPGTQIQEQSRR